MARILVALGGNAIARRGQPATAEVQLENISAACGPLAAAAVKNELIITHGNGPQVGLLALQNAAYTEVPAYPLDILGAQTQGMIGYLIELTLRNVLPAGRQVSTVLTNVVVDADDPAYSDPTKFVGPVYGQEEAAELAQRYGWEFKEDGEFLRRVVPSPLPTAVLQADAVDTLLRAGHVVISTGGGGIPLIETEAGTYEGTEVVVDKDASSSLLARSADVDFFVMATDAPAVVEGWGTPEARVIRRVTPEKLESLEFAAGSMGPKVDAAVRFVRATGRTAAIGNLNDIEAILEGRSGTLVVPQVEGDIEYA